MSKSKQYKGGSGGGGGGTGTLSQVLTAGNDGTGQSMVGINSITASILRSVSATNLTIVADSGGEVIISDNGNNAANAIGTNLTGNGGYVALKDGAVGGVAIGWAAGTGHYLVSGTQIGVSVAGALQMTIDSVIGGIGVSAISELIGGVGIIVKGIGDLSFINIGGNIIFSDGVTTGAITVGGSPVFSGTVLGVTNITVVNGLVTSAS